MSSFDHDWKQSQRKRELLDRQTRDHANTGLVLLGMAMVAFWLWFWWEFSA